MNTPKQTPARTPERIPERTPGRTLVQKLDTAKKRLRYQAKVGLFGVFLLLGLLALIYFTQRVAFQVAPTLAADTVVVSVADGIGLAFSDRVYLFGKQAVLRFESPGFISQRVSMKVKKDAQPVLVKMQEAPVRVVITTQPPLPQTRWYVDGIYATTAERFAQEFQSGIVNIEINHDFYHVQTLQLDVQIGKDITRQLNLIPLSGNINIDSEPSGARVQLYNQTDFNQTGYNQTGSKNKGVTPMQISSLAGGLYRIHVILDGYENIAEEIALTNRLPDIKRNYRLKLKQANLRINTAPVGGVLRINGVVADTDANPLSLVVGKQYTLRYEKSGYIAQVQNVLIKRNEHQPDEQMAISFQLEKAMGEVVIRSTPAADIRINGASIGTAPQVLHLQTVPQKITLRRVGYRSQTFIITPITATPLRIDKTLKTESAARLAEATPFLNTASGIKMKFFDPSAQAKNRFAMGSPRTDQHRRANEFQRQVNLTKPFYVSTSEITEQQFSQYKPIPITGGHLPVRNVSWLDAAGFANWMSQQDGLQPAYTFVDGQMSDFNATSDGYRLLSEAEWEWLARIANRAASSRFVWGNNTTIPKNSGNFADQSAKGNVAKYIARYSDGFVGVAPVASFAADAVGLYDMAGNVSEWVHDVYSLQPPQAGQVERDPFGGKHTGRDDYRVIKGSSFRSASVTRLRSSFRKGLSQNSSSRRDDVGFRIARYLYGQE